MNEQAGSPAAVFLWEMLMLDTQDATEERGEQQTKYRGKM